LGFELLLGAEFVGHGYGVDRWWVRVCGVVEVGVEKVAMRWVAIAVISVVRNEKVGLVIA
jgi:hypothetical protein